MCTNYQHNMLYFTSSHLKIVLLCVKSFTHNHIEVVACHYEFARRIWLYLCCS